MRLRGLKCIIGYLFCVVPLFMIDLAVGSLMGNFVLYMKDNTSISWDELEARFSENYSSFYPFHFLLYFLFCFIQFLISSTIL